MCVSGSRRRRSRTGSRRRSARRVRASTRGRPSVLVHAPAPPADRRAARARCRCRRPHLVERRAQLGHGGADAREVRHRLQPVLVLDPLDDLDRLLAGRAARAVGDRHERRVERRAARRAPRTGCARRPRSWAGRTRTRTPARRRRGSDRCASAQIMQSSARALRGCGRRTLAVRLADASGSRAIFDSSQCAFCGRARRHRRAGRSRRPSAARPSTRRAARAVRRSSTSSRLPSMWACTSVKVRPCPARHRRAPSRSTTSSELRNSPTGSGE